jgi:hypothetical protein
MRPSPSLRTRRGPFAGLAVVGLATAWLASLDGCSSTKSPTLFGKAGASGAAAGAGGAGGAGAGGAAGASAGAGQSGDAGAAAGAGQGGGAGASAGGGGAAGTADAGPTGGGQDAGAATGSTGTPDATGAAGAGASIDLTKVSPSAGCGNDAPAALTPGMLVRQTMQTMGVKDANCADSRCGAWSFLREYFVRLPTGYDKTKAYPLVIEGPACGGRGDGLYAIAAFDSTVIRVGLSPSAEAQAFHSTNPGQGCFDDKEGDDSIEWTFYEALHDQLASTVCFDRNRVFAAGTSSGAWLANELGCKYAGDAKHPIRGVMANTGGLPTDPKYVPTCTRAPMAGMWSFQPPLNPDTFSGNYVAVNRALSVDGCVPAGVTWTTAMTEGFPIGGINSDTTCKRVSGCPNLVPLVVCELPFISNELAANATVVVPGWPTFLGLFSKAPLLTP